MTATISREQAETLGEGVVLAVRERNGYNDSDFSALVALTTPNGWGFKWVETGSTRFAGGFVARVDASEDAKEAYRAYKAKDDAAQRARIAAQQERMIEKGKAVTVVKARVRGKDPVAAGTTGTVTWRGEDQYNSSQWHTAYRVGFRTEDGNIHYMPEESLRVSGFEDQDLGKVHWDIEAMGTLPTI